MPLYKKLVGSVDQHHATIVFLLDQMTRHPTTSANMHALWGTISRYLKLSDEIRCADHPRRGHSCHSYLAEVYKNCRVQEKPTTEPWFITTLADMVTLISPGTRPQTCSQLMAYVVNDCMNMGKIPYAEISTMMAFIYDAKDIHL